MAKPQRGLKVNKKRQRRPKNVKKTSKNKGLPQDVKKLSLTLSDIREANDISPTLFERTMMKRSASAPRRYQLVKNAVEAHGIHFDHEVKSQVYNVTKSPFVAEQVITINYTELKKSQFLSFVNNAGKLIQKCSKILTNCICKN